MQMTDKAEFLDRDVAEMKIVDLKRGIATLGGVIPPGTTLKRQIYEIFVQCRQNYIYQAASYSVNTATFVSQSPANYQESAAIPSQLPAPAFNRPAAQVAFSTQQPDLTMNAFYITGANMLNEQIKTQLHIEQYQFSGETQPLKPLRPPKGIEHTPNYDDLESFIHPQTVIYQVQLSYQAAAQYASSQQQNASALGENQLLAQSYIAPASVSNFDFTTHFTYAQLTDAALDSTVRLDEKVREFYQTTISEEMRRTQSYIDALHQYMKSILANVGSPLKDKIVNQQIVVPAGQEIAESQGDPVVKPKKNPKPVQKKQFKQKEINAAYKRLDAYTHKPRVSPLQNAQFDYEETKSELRPEDLYFRVAGSQKQRIADVDVHKSINVESTIRRGKPSRLAVFLVIAGSFAFLVLSTVFVNALAQRQILRIPFLTRGAQLAVTAILPRQYYERSQTLTSVAYITPNAKYSDDSEFIGCADGYVYAVERDLTQIADFRLRQRNALVNLRKRILCELERRRVYYTARCILNDTDALVYFYSEQQLKNVLRRKLVKHYSTHLRETKTEMDCYLNNVCYIKHKRYIYEVQLNAVTIDLSDYFLSNEIPQFLMKTFNLTIEDQVVYAAVSLDLLRPHFGAFAAIRLYFALRPFIFVLKMLTAILVLTAATYCTYRTFVALLTRKYYASAVEHLRRLKRANEQATARSAQLLAGLLDSRFPDFIKEEVLCNVEKHLQLCEKVDTRYARNVFGEVEMEFLWVGGIWSERGPTSFLDDEESTHTIEY